jgi:hypothetical protein
MGDQDARIEALEADNKDLKTRVNFMEAAAAQAAIKIDDQATSLADMKEVGVLVEAGGGAGTGRGGGRI